jgi:hypothetical protein
MSTEPSKIAEMLTDITATEITIGKAYGERSFNNAPLRPDARMFQQAVMKRLVQYFKDFERQREELSARAHEQMQAAQWKLKFLDAGPIERELGRHSSTVFEDDPESAWGSASYIYFRNSLLDLDDPIDQNQMLRWSALKWLRFQKGLLKY